MSEAGYSFGQYLYEKKKKRDQLGGSVTTPGTAVILPGTFYTQGPFIAETIWVSNYDTVTITFSILDGAEYKLRDVSLAAGAFVNITPIFMPFFTSVSFDASSVSVICTVGGWIP